MRSFDPFSVALAAALTWAAVVGLLIVGRLNDTQGSTAVALAPEASGAVSIRGGPQLDVDPVSVTIEPGTGADAIAAQLVAAGVLSSDVHFSTLLTLSGVGAELRAGSYEFAPGTPAAEVIRQLRFGLAVERLLVVPEGLRLEQVGELVAAAGIATQEEWELVVALRRSERIALGRPEGASLNGYLFPASYPIRDDTNATNLVAAMIGALDSALGPVLQAQIAISDLSLHEVLTLASIVEREAVLVEEQPIVASVFLNRLEQGIKLDADPTVQYAITIGFDEEPEDGWWKLELTLDDLALESPYNTYVSAGLPHGPIANPGLGAIEAVMRPAETDFLYFVARGDGSHVFAETLEEHNANVAEFLGR